MRPAAWIVAAPMLLMVPAPLAASTSAISGTAARNAKAAFVYLSQATKDAALKPLDAALIEQRKRADALGAKLAETQSSLAKLRQVAGTSKAQLAALEAQLAREAGEAAAAREAFTAELAAKDADYARELAVLRTAADAILSTPEGLKYLEANNAGDLAAADAIEEKLIAARQKMRDLQAAADRRAFATVALDNRNKGLRTTAIVLARFEDVTKLDPGKHQDWVTLASLYADVGNITASDGASRLAEEVATSPHERIGGLLAIATVLRARGQPSVALDTLTKALKIAQAPSDGGTLRALRFDAALLLLRIGEVLKDLGRKTEAVDATRRSIAACEALATEFPTDLDAREQAGRGYIRLGELLVLGGDLDAGLDAYKRAMAIRNALTAAAPASLSYQRDLASAMTYMARLSMRRSPTAEITGETERSFRAALAIYGRLASVDSSSSRAKRDLLVIHNDLGKFLIDEKRYPEALAIMVRARTIGAELVDRDTKSGDFLQSYRQILTTLGVAYLGSNDLDAAMEAFQASQRIASTLRGYDPKSVVAANGDFIARINVAEVLIAKSDREGARQSLRALIDDVRGVMRANPDAVTLKETEAEIAILLAKAGDTAFTYKVAYELGSALVRSGSATKGFRLKLESLRQAAEQGSPNEAAK